MTASNVVENYDWETIFKLGMFVLVVVIGYVYLYCFSTEITHQQFIDKNWAHISS